jgi:hypothetical protein
MLGRSRFSESGMLEIKSNKNSWDAFCAVSGNAFQLFYSNRGFLLTFLCFRDKIKGKNKVKKEVIFTHDQH